MGSRLHSPLKPEGHRVNRQDLGAHLQQHLQEEIKVETPTAAQVGPRLMAQVRQAVPAAQEEETGLHQPPEVMFSSHVCPLNRACGPQSLTSRHGAPVIG